MTTSSRLVTVFGGSGFIGGQAVRELARLGWRIRVAVRKPNTAHDLRPLGDVGQIQLMRCDVTRQADVEAALRGADAVVNLVGTFNTRRFQAMHVDAARYIAEGCAANGITRLVQVSANGADAKSPAVYGRSKAEAEAIMRERVPGAVILRPSVVFGAEDDFLNRFAAMASMSPALPLIGGGETRFQPVYVGDVAQAIARAASAPGMEGQTFTLGGPAIYTFKQILELILRETYRERVLIPVPFFAARPLGSLLQVAELFGLPAPLTRDQVLMLESDNVVPEGAPGLAALGVAPTGLEAIAPTYLWLYRRGGQFAEPVAA